MLATPQCARAHQMTCRTDEGKHGSKTIFPSLPAGAGVQDLPKNWLYLRTSCGGDPQQGWSNVEVPLLS